MTTWLTEEFIAGAQHEPLAVTFGEHDLTLRRSAARRDGTPGYGAELEVVEGDVVLGYITPYSEHEHGAVRADQFHVALPVLHRTLDGALGEIL
ncbi:hypothetical protein WJX64_00300 [Leifsonia sp. YIM 134122]|uniref:HIRAN domain-containing protein n=1 Tax=Leifsonia stereocauli TaxID=3134136 RepID=A0ABU9VZI1_9MICO